MKITIKRVGAVNELAFKDVVSEGLRKLQKKNLHVVHYHSFQQENRKRKLDVDVYDEINQYSNGSNESIEDEIDLVKLKQMRHN